MDAKETRIANMAKDAWSELSRTTSVNLCITHYGLAGYTLPGILLKLKGYLPAIVRMTACHSTIIRFGIASDVEEDSISHGMNVAVYRGCGEVIVLPVNNHNQTSGSDRRAYFGQGVGRDTNEYDMTIETLPLAVTADVHFRAS